MRKFFKSWIFKILILLLLIGATIWVIFSNTDIAEFKRVFNESNKLFLLAGVGCMFVFWFIEAGIIHMLIQKISPTKIRSKWTALKTTVIGQYYSNLTPFASGGQPIQLYVLKQGGLSFSNGTAVLVCKFLLFQVSVTVYSLGLAILRFSELTSTLSGAASFVFIGLGINTIGLTFIIAMAFKPVALEQLIIKCINGLEKIHLIRHKESKIAKVRGFVHEYHEGIEELRKDVGLTLGMFLMSFVQLTFFFGITYFIYLALGLSGAALIDIISLQALLYMAVSFVPIPGTVGASETGFALLFGSIFTGNFAAVAMVIWRGISYYFSLIFCGLFTGITYLIDHFKGVKSNA